jgi:hypothetical protein
MKKEIAVATSQYDKRKAKVASVEAIEEPPEEVIVYDRTAHDVLFDPKKRKYVRVNLEYNLTTGQARVKDTKDIADSQPVATMKITELFTRKILGIPPRYEK